MSPCRLRISLGLKPLSNENESDKQRKAQQEREAQKAAEEKERKAAELAERVKACVSPSISPYQENYMWLVSGILHVNSSLCLRPRRQLRRRVQGSSVGKARQSICLPSLLKFHNVTCHMTDQAVQE